MKSVIAIASFIGLAAAQFQGLPSCAQACAGTFLANGIGNCGSDPKCICQDKSFIGDIACCLAKPGGCNAADQSSAVDFASQLCAANGVTVPSAVSCTATSTGGSTAAATDATTTGTAKATTTATATGTARETTTATATGAATTGSSSSSSSSSATGTTTGAAATGATTGSASSAGAQTTSASSSTSNPAQRETAGVMALVGGVAAALAML